MTCPQCGAPLNIDVLTREPRPCTECGATYSLDSEERPQPEAEHQQTINRQKYFEIASVIIMILVGFGYLALSVGKNQASSVTLATVSELETVLLDYGLEQLPKTQHAGQHLQNYLLKNNVLETYIGLASPMDSPDAIVETITVVTVLPAKTPMPADTVLQPAIQNAFNSHIKIGESLIPRSTVAIQKAATTTIPVSTFPLKHLKGVAQTSNGWKVTYINYREHEESEKEVPLLIFVYQNLDVASNKNTEEFNQYLYDLINYAGNKSGQIKDHHEIGGQDAN